MALQKVMSSMRHQMHRLMGVSARHYSNEANINEPVSNLDPKNEESTRPYSSEANVNTASFDPKNQEEFEQTVMDTEYKRGVEGINEVFLTGTIFGEVLPTTTGNGVTFLVDIFHNGRYGQYKVRTKVVAIGTALPAQGAEVLKEGQKVFVRGRLGSKVERSLDGSSVVRTNHVVSRFITTI